MDTVRIQINKDYTTRKDTLNGVEHLVVPVVMMREGVHNGSAGSIYHTAAELGRYVEAWNGIPVTITHPQQDGASVSANAPLIREQYCVGTIYNARMDGDKLRAEAWIVPADLHRISTDTEDLLNNLPL